MYFEHQGISIAYDSLVGNSPTVVFLPGFNSNRQGNKAQALNDYCVDKSHAFLRFDYRAHGDSSGDFADCCIDDWLADVLAVIDQLCQGELILVGSSMGGWLALLAALQRPQRIKGLLLIACAADMTRYYPARLEGLESETDQQGRQFFNVPNQYDDEADYLIYQQLIDSGAKHFLLDSLINLDMPVRLLHGDKDDVVPWQRSQSVLNALSSSDVSLRVLQGGDHRLSLAEHQSEMLNQLENLIDLA